MTCGFNCNKTGVVCLRHQSVTLFLVAYPLLRNVLALRCEVFPFDFLCSGCFIFKMSLLLNTVTLLIGDDTIYRPCHFSILYYQELRAAGTTMPTSLLPFMYVRSHACRTNTKQFSILFQGPKIWNSLPNSVTSIFTLQSFKTKVFDFLLYR